MLIVRDRARLTDVICPPSTIEQVSDELSVLLNDTDFGVTKVATSRIYIGLVAG